MCRLIVCLSFMFSFGAMESTRAVEPWADRQLTVTDGLDAWYDAATLHRQPKSLVDGRFVSEWPDASGQGRVARSSRADFRPQLYVDTSDHHQSTSVRFDGLDDYLSADGPVEREALTICLVVRPISNNGAFRGMIAGAAHAQNDYNSGFNVDLGFPKSADWSDLNVEGTGAGGAQNLIGKPKPFGQFHLVIIQFDPSAGVRSFIDGEPAGERAWNKAALHLEELVLGARLYRNEPGPAYVQGFGECDLAEVLIYGRSLTNGERVEVEAISRKSTGPF